MRKPERLLSYTWIWLILLCLPISSFAADKVTLQLIWKNQFQFAGYYVAKELGFYADAGLDVTIKEYESGTDVTADVVSQRAHFGVGRSSLILEHMEGKPVHLLAAIFQHSPNVLLAKKRDDLGQVSNLKGKRIMVTGDSVQMASLTAMLVANAIKPDQYIPQKHTFSIDDLISGNTDAISAYISNEPYQMEQKGIDYTIFAPKDHGFDFYGDILFTSQKFYKDNPQLVERFHQASLRGWEYAFSHIDEVVDIILKKYNTQNRGKDALRFEADKLKELAYDQDTTLGLLTKSRVEQISQVYRLLGLSNKALQANNLIFSPKDKTRVHLTPEEQEWLSKHNKIVVGGEMDWAPFDFVDESGKYAGVANDYLQIISEKLGLEVEVVTGFSWNELLEMIRLKKIDVLPAIYHSKERETYLHYTSPYTRVTEFIFARDDTETISTIEDLRGKTVSVVKGYNIEDLLRTHYPDIHLVTAPTIQTALQKLVTNEAVAFINDINSTVYTIEQYSLTGIQPIAAAPFREPAVHMAVRKDFPLLRDLIQKIFDAMTSDEHRFIKNRWVTMPKDRQKKEDDGKKVQLTPEETAWLAEKQVIRLGYYIHEPVIFKNEDGELVGIVPDYYKLLEKRLGVRIEIHAVKWAKVFNLLKNNEIDFIPLLNSVTAEEQGFISVQSTSNIITTVFAKRGRQFQFASLKDLAGLRVTFVKDIIFIKDYLQTRRHQIEIVEAGSTLDCLNNVLKGEADVMLGINIDNYEIINRSIREIEPVFYTEELDPKFVTALRPDESILAAILEKAMADISREELRAINRRWTGLDEKEYDGTQTQPTTEEKIKPISYNMIIIYSVVVFLFLSLIAWILIKTIKKENIAVSFGSPWFRGLVLAGLSVFVLIVAFLGWYNLERNKTQHLQDLDESLRGFLSVGQDRLDLWVAQRASSMKLFGRNPELVAITKCLLAVPPNREDLLASGVLCNARTFFSNNEEIFANMGFFIISPDFVSIGSMRDTNIGTRNLISEQYPELLQQAFQGKVGFVPPLTSDVHLGNSSKSDKAKKPPTMFFIGPVMEKDGRVLAVVTLRVDPWKDFSQAVKSFVSAKTGETYAFDSNGRMLSVSRFEDQLHRIGLLLENQSSALNIEIRDPGGNLLEGHRPNVERSQQPLTHMASRAVALQQEMEKTGIGHGLSPIESSLEGYRDYRGVPVFGAWLWNGDLNIGLAIEVDVDEALANFYRTRITIFSILGFTLFLSVGAILFVLIIGERTSRALERARDNLERKVGERTTELMDKQEQLGKSEERSRLLLDSVGEGIFGVDLDGKVTFINSAANRLLGYEPNELIGQGVHERIHHTRADGSPYPVDTCPMAKAYTHGITGTISNEMLWRKDGSGLSVEYTATPVLRGEEITGAVITFRDITERKRMEEALSDERERLQGILDISPIGLAFSTEAKIHFANPRFKEMFGVGVGDPAPNLYVDPVEREKVVSKLSAEGKVENYELQMYNRDHEVRDILSTFLPITFDGEEGILGWLLDITDSKKAEKEIKEKYDELERFRRLAVGRETKMIDLKREINVLVKENGHPERYKIH